MSRTAALARAIDRVGPGPGGRLCVMHVCGTHENAICQHGLRDLLPPWLRVVAGPGCPVCVCPAADIDLAGRLAVDAGVVLTTFGDLFRVPAGRRTLEDVRAKGADVRIVYSIDAAIAIAEREPRREVVFFAAGFETTACTTAAALARGLPDNLSLLCSHRLVPPALSALLGSGRIGVDALLLPGHVTAVIGLDGYAGLGRVMPMTVAGFEPEEILTALLDVVERAAAGQGGCSNAYARAVAPGGNVHAKRMIAEVFEVRDAPWRGVGSIASSGLYLAPSFARYDALTRFGLEPDPRVPETEPGCRCGEVLLAAVEPEECPLFGRRCDPSHPVGPCMVGSEGTCRARLRYSAGRGGVV